MKKYRIVYGYIGLILAMTVPAAGETWAIRGARLIPVSGPVVEKGHLIIREDFIESLGPDAVIPGDAALIEGDGLWVYPGLIDAFSTLGLTEVGAVQATVDVTETGRYNPHIRAISAINPHSVHIPVTRVNGITTALVAPDGGVVSGQCALINLDGWTAHEMALEPSVAMRINFPLLPSPSGSRRGGRGGETPTEKRTGEQIQNLKDLLFKARRYADAVEAHYKDPGLQAPLHDVMLEALIPLVRGEQAAIVCVNTAKDIENAVAFVKETGIRAVFQGVYEGWKVADLLRENDIPVLVGSLFRSVGPRDPYDAIYANPGILSSAGVKTAFLTGSAADARNLPYQAGTAAAFGMNREEALKSVTLYPARILGVDHLVGSLEPGKLANVVVTDGDILEMRTQIRYLFIKGKRISLETKDTELFEKFRKRN